MRKYIYLASGILIGVITGLHLRTARIKNLLNQLEEANNEVIENLSYVYQTMPDYDPGKFTEDDMALLNMWQSEGGK